MLNHFGDIVVLDTETTGVDVKEARVVTAFLGRMKRDQDFSVSQHILVNPGVEIPAEATAVHGITTAHAQERGMAPEAALQQIRWIIEFECIEWKNPLVVFNAPYDLTLLRNEFDRYGIPQLDWEQIIVIDPSVLDKVIFPKRWGKGMRKLTNTVGFYGVPVEENAHDAAADCLMAGRLAHKQLQHPAFAHHNLPSLHAAQVEWKREQSESLQAHFRKTKPDEVVDPGWPFAPGVAA